MLKSMTGFAAREGASEGWRWSWELRSVNGRGLDIRLRLPDWPGGLDQACRAELQKRIGRGSVTLSLRLQKDGSKAAGTLNAAGLSAALVRVREIETRAAEADLGLRPSSPGEIAAMPGVIESGESETDPDPMRRALIADLPALVEAFDEMRISEGAALAGVIGGQIETIRGAVAQARGLLSERTAHVADSFRSALARIVENADGVNEDRIAQELAVMAVKADISEELDRLDAHVAAAEALLSGDGPKGRKLDFLTQEFNREANTLCSKAGYAPLTAIGLDLKHTIDQMREQVQNVE